MWNRKVYSWNMRLYCLWKEYIIVKVNSFFSSMFIMFDICVKKTPTILDQEQYS